MQKDAEELLGCLLNGMNDEMHELTKLMKKTVTTQMKRQEETNWKAKTSNSIFYQFRTGKGMASN